MTELEPLAPLVARNAEHRLRLLQAAGGALSAAEAGVLLGISRQAVDKRRRTGGLLAFRKGSDWQYPRCQFDHGEVIPGVPEVVRGMDEAGPWAALDFLLAPDTVLDGLSPLEALRRGGEYSERVFRLVRASRGDGFA